MDANLQRRVQRYGWDLAAPDYEPLWATQLSAAQAKLLACARLGPGERVLDVACGTGLVTFDAARRVAMSGGHVVGIDISGGMIGVAMRRAVARDLAGVSFQRMDAEFLEFPDASFDVVLCALGLMYFPDPERALSEMRRVLKPGGRLVVAVWGERQRCGWSAVFPIVDGEVHSDVCPLFFRLGHPETLAKTMGESGFDMIEVHRIGSTLEYEDADSACDAMFVAGPVALAWSRFDAQAKERARTRYLDSIGAWRNDRGYRIPGEFVVAQGMRNASASPMQNKGG